MKAILNKVVVEPEHVENVDETGVIMGKQESEKFAVGKVISVGSEAKHINEGDRAWYDKNRASEIIIKGKVFFVMDNFNIFVIED